MISRRNWDFVPLLVGGLLVVASSIGPASDASAAQQIRVMTLTGANLRCNGEAVNPREGGAVRTGDLVTLPYLDRRRFSECTLWLFSHYAVGSAVPRAARSYGSFYALSRRTTGRIDIRPARGTRRVSAHSRLPLGIEIRPPNQAPAPQMLVRLSWLHPVVGREASLKWSVRMTNRGRELIFHGGRIRIAMRPNQAIRSGVGQGAGTPPGGQERIGERRRRQYGFGGYIFSGGPSPVGMRIRIYRCLPPRRGDFTSCLRRRFVRETVSTDARVPWGVSRGDGRRIVVGKYSFRWLTSGSYYVAGQAKLGGVDLAWLPRGLRITLPRPSSSSRAGITGYNLSFGRRGAFYDRRADVRGRVVTTTNRPVRRVTIVFENCNQAGDRCVPLDPPLVTGRGGRFLNKSAALDRGGKIKVTPYMRGYSFEPRMQLCHYGSCNLPPFVRQNRP